MNLDKEQIIRDAVNTYGVTNQFDQAIEELGELITAINKIKRTFKSNRLPEIKQRLESLSFDGEKKGKGFDSVNEALVYCNVCSEIADVKIMIKQLEYIFSVDHIHLSEERKLARLSEGIEKFKNKTSKETGDNKS